MARQGLLRNRKFVRLSRLLSRYCQAGGDIAAAGALELLWSAAYESADSYIGNSDDVEAAARWVGPEGKLTEALLASGGSEAVGFIEELEEGRYWIHDFWDHCPDYVKKRSERESEREIQGQTISDLRSKAGKKGAAARLANKQMSVRLLDNETNLCEQMEGRLLGNGCGPETPIDQLDEQLPNNCQTFVSNGRTDAFPDQANLATPLSSPPLSDQIKAKEKIPARKRRAEKGGDPVALERLIPYLSVCERFTPPEVPEAKHFVMAAVMIKSYPDVESWKVVGEWLAAGGFGYFDMITVDFVRSKMGECMTAAKKWGRAGKPEIAKWGGQQMRRSQAPVSLFPSTAPIPTADELGTFSEEDDR